MPDAVVSEALRLLGIDNLVLGVHDPSFPTLEREDTGRGTPYGDGARRFLEKMRAMGFDGLQLGPQGATSRDNASPYDGTIFSRNPLSIALSPLIEEGLLSRATFDDLVAQKPPSSLLRVDHRYAHDAQRRALDEAYATFRGQSRDRSSLDAFARAHESWLTRDALYQPLCRQHGAGHWRSWPTDQGLWDPPLGEERACAERRVELIARHRDAIDAYAFEQHLVHAQHAHLQRWARAHRLKLFGDLQIGFSEPDAWNLRGLFLHGYRMGAPPSRTHPLGQAWNYPVYDPDQFGDAVRRIFSARVVKMLSEFDGVRIDHPHGLVCPWVYLPDERDPLAAVRAGARLFSAPDLQEHTRLQRFSICTPEQLDRSQPRWGESYVRALDPEQVERYGALFQLLVDAARQNGRAITDLPCEVLSTLPFQLKSVLDRHGLGRFRVTQKADLSRPDDVYRSENARPEDWIMLGNHDTQPIWGVVTKWQETKAIEAHARYLAERLCPSVDDRPRLAEALARDEQSLVEAKFAELFSSRARNVMIFFADVFGHRDAYNEPGTIRDENWSTRIPSDWESQYRKARRERRALDLPKALATALRAKGFGATHRDVVDKLEGLSRDE